MPILETCECAPILCDGSIPVEIEMSSLQCQNVVSTLKRPLGLQREYPGYGNLQVILRRVFLLQHSFTKVYKHTRHKYMDTSGDERKT